MNELGLEPKADSILPTTNGKSQTIEEQLIQKAIKEGIERALLNPVSTEPIGTPEAPDPELEHPDTILVKPNDNVSLPSGEVVNEVKAPDEVIPWYELPGVFPTRADLISDDDPPDVVVEKRVRAWQRAQDILKRELQDGNSKT